MATIKRSTLTALLLFIVTPTVACTGDQQGNRSDSSAQATTPTPTPDSQNDNTHRGGPWGRQDNNNLGGGPSDQNNTSGDNEDVSTMPAFVSPELQGGSLIPSAPTGASVGGTA